jgi:hypothetical protein
VIKTGPPLVVYNALRPYTFAVVRTRTQLPSFRHPSLSRAEFERLNRVSVLFNEMFAVRTLSAHCHIGLVHVRFSPRPPDIDAL